MMITNFFILTADQRTAAAAFDNEDVALGARAIDNTTPGVGLNLNPDAVGVAAGAAVTLTGKYVTSKRIVDDDQYQTYAPGMVALLLTLPWAALEPETIFAPVEPV